MAIGDVAKMSFMPGKMPPGLEPGFYQTGTSPTGLPNYPNGCHVCEVEIDEETGVVDIVKYSVVDDVGTVINPLLLKGQIHGGIVQGAGQALMEDFSMDAESGQVIAGSFMDYCMPRAADFCSFNVGNNEVPTQTNPLGVKGAGEAGTVGALSAVMSAVNSALEPLGADFIDMPATPNKVWGAIRNAKA
jgi:carbon-monoxide dehydrogenase large subunit